MGRPSLYSDALAAEVCERLASGEGLVAICRDNGMPGQTTVYRWLSENPEFRERYAHAREAQADHYADEIIEIIDTEPDPARARVRMDGRKWVASKLYPKKYGDKTVHEHGSDPEKPVVTRIEVVLVRPGEPAQLGESVVQCADRGLSQGSRMRLLR